MAGAIRSIVLAGQEAGEFAPVDADDFTITLSAVLDGLAVQIALDDPAVPPQRTYDFAMRFAAGQLGFDWEPAPDQAGTQAREIAGGGAVAGGSIELSGLTKRFGEIAVDNIDLTVASGEFFSLLGPSGCGKTTTLRLIAGFEQPTSGQILLDGVDVSDVPPHRRNVNTVFQSYALFPFLTVFDNVAFGLRHRGVGKAELRRRVDEALDLVR